jgi:hypothetical protein
MLAALLMLCDCAGRPPQPVALIQPQDRQADCQAIIIEVQANNALIADLGGDQGGKVAQNVAKEVAALQSRQQYLAVLAEQKHCGTD